MSLNITKMDEKKFSIDVMYNNSEFCEFIIKKNLEQNIFFKTDFLNTCTNNKHLLNYLFNHIRNTCYTNKNIIQIFIEDRTYNLSSNKSLAINLIKIFDNYNYEYFFMIVDNIMNNYIIKSQYLEIDIVNDIYYKKKERSLLNFTYLLIEMYEQKFKHCFYHKYKLKLLDNIIYLLDIGVINLYEELNKRLQDLRDIKDQLVIGNINNINYFLLVNESRELLKREIYIKTQIDNIFPCVGDFIDYLINNFYTIRNKDIFNIVFVFKQNNPFIYKNTNNFITFSKLVMQFTLINNPILVIDYTNFYIDLCFNYKKNIYLNKISNKIFIENILESAHKISKTDNFIYIYMTNICKTINYINKKKHIIERIDIDILKKFTFIILNNFKYYYEHFYSTRAGCSFKYLIDFLSNINTKILVSFELRNIYIENLFYMLENIFTEEHQFLFDDINAIKINNLLVNMLNSNYNSVLNYFSFDVNNFNSGIWNKYIEYFGHQNYLILNFQRTIHQQLEFNKKNCIIDPICSNIIEEPISIPNTDVIMDKYIIYRCLMDNEINPFNRNKLTIQDLISYNKSQTLNKK